MPMTKSSLFSCRVGRVPYPEPAVVCASSPVSMIPCHRRAWLAQKIPVVSLLRRVTWDLITVTVFFSSKLVATGIERLFHKTLGHQHSTPIVTREDLVNVAVQNFGTKNVQETSLIYLWRSEPLATDDELTWQFVPRSQEVSTSFFQFPKHSKANLITFSSLSLKWSDTWYQCLFFALYR
jgi:hypothetical protein